MVLQKKKKKRKVLARQLNEMQKQYHVTWDDCRTSMIPIGKNMGLMLYLTYKKPKMFGEG